MNQKAKRFQLYPAAANAARGFLAIEVLPARLRPAPPGTNWPAFLNENFGDEYSDQYEHNPDTPDKRAMPSPHEIDMAWEWLAPCKWMWAVGYDRQEWDIFRAYSLGMGVRAIGGKYNRSRWWAAKRLDRIFYLIQYEAEILALRGDL